MVANNKQARILLIASILFFIVTCVISQEVTSSNTDYSSKIDEKILDKFDKKDTVEITIILDDLNDIELQKDKLFEFEKQGFVQTGKSLTGGWISGRIPRSILTILDSDPDISRVYSPELMSIHLSESVPLIEGDVAWNISINGSNTSVCVIDTGVDYDHPNLLGKVVAQKCYCQLPEDGQQYCCPDGTTIDENSSDNGGHGTHVAGIITSNHQNLRGVSYGANIVAVKVCNSTGSCHPDDIAYGIDWCRMNKNNYSIAAISISLGGGLFDNSSKCDNSSEGVEILKAYNDNLITVVSSGNKGNYTMISSPACVSKAVSVGSVYDDDVGGIGWCVQTNSSGHCVKYCWDYTTNSDKIVCSSNRGSLLDVIAPGALINSTWPFGNGFSEEGGTSMAAPHVSGVVALMKQANENLSVEQMKYILNFTGNQIFDSQSNMNYSRVNAYNASLMALYSDFFEVSNEGDVNLSVTEINSSASWITNVYPRSFTVEPGHNQTVMVTVDLGDEEEIGSYSTNVMVHSNDPDESQKPVQINYKRIHEGCGVGDCPPGSGDWTVDEYTAVWLNDTYTDGDVKIQSGATLFLGELESNVTGVLEFTDGELKLDDTEFKFI